MGKNVLTFTTSDSNVRGVENNIQDPRRRPFDAVILDNKLPKINGLEVARKFGS
jgi:DNA-binding response OmpR family regulator